MSHVPLYKVWDTTPTVQLECLVIFLTTAIELAAQQPAGMHAAALMPSCMCLNSNLKEKGPQKFLFHASAELLHAASSN
jgi:hypothetical protein